MIPQIILQSNSYEYVCYWSKSRHKDQWNEINIPEINSHISNNLWQMMWEKWADPCKTLKLDQSFHSKKLIQKAREIIQGLPQFDPQNHIWSPEHYQYWSFIANLDVCSETYRCGCQTKNNKKRKKKKTGKDNLKNNICGRHQTNIL